METIEKISDTEVKITTPQEPIVSIISIDTLMANLAIEKSQRDEMAADFQRQLDAKDAKIAGIQAKIDKVMQAGVQVSADVAVTP